MAIGRKRDALYRDFSLDTDVKAYSRDFLRSWDQVNQWASTTRSVISNAKVLENLRALRAPSLPVPTPQAEAKPRKAKKAPKSEPTLAIPDAEQVDLFAQPIESAEVVLNQEATESNASLSQVEESADPIDTPAVGADVVEGEGQQAPVGINNEDSEATAIEDDAEVVIDVFAKQRARIAKDIEEFSFDELLSWWLKDSFNQNFYVLFTIFLVLTFVSCQSQILISLYEVKEITKKNSLFESFVIIPFIYLLFLIVSKGDVVLICYLILIKEIILFLIRFYYLKKYIICFNLYIFSIFIFLLFWILKIFDLNYLSIFVKASFLFLIFILIYYLSSIYKKKGLYT